MSHTNSYKSVYKKGRKCLCAISYCMYKFLTQSVREENLWAVNKYACFMHFANLLEKSWTKVYYTSPTWEKIPKKGHKWSNFLFWLIVCLFTLFGFCLVASKTTNKQKRMRYCIANCILHVTSVAYCMHFVVPLSQRDTWLILPVVICLSQRLSHACLRISPRMVNLRMAH